MTASFEWAEQIVFEFPGPRATSKEVIMSYTTANPYTGLGIKAFVNHKLIDVVDIDAAF